MAPGRRKARRELEIVSLIDVVFLLIVFGIAISLFVNPHGLEPGEKPNETLRIEIRRKGLDATERKQPLAVTITYPDDFVAPLTETFPSDDSLVALNEEDFEAAPACRLIGSHIEAFVRDYLTNADQEEFPQFIDVQVSKDTKLRIVSFILKTCAAHRKNLYWVRLGSL